MTETPKTATPVTLIGLGPMGQAMTRTLLAAGHPVTLWNRTASRATELVAEGAVLAPTPTEAVQAADLIILSLTDYQAMYDILGQTHNGSDTDALSGRTIVNLSSDTPEHTRAAAAWAEEHGARFVTGGVMGPAPTVGTDAIYVYYSGPRDTFDTHEPTLCTLGEPRYVGADPGLAQLYYQAQLDVFLTTLSSLLHATALIGSAGVSATEFLPEALKTVTDIAELMGDAEAAGKEIDTGHHPGDLSTAIMMGATADHILEASEAAGIDLELPQAVKSHYDRAIAAGHGHDNWTSIFETIKRPT